MKIKNMEAIADAGATGNFSYQEYQQQIFNQQSNLSQSISQMDPNSGQRTHVT